MTLPVALDFMAGDWGADATVPGALQAAALGIPVMLVGDRKRIPERYRAAVAGEANLTLVTATHSAPMESAGRTIPHHNPGDSLTVATELVRAGRASVVVTTGNTGAAVLAGIRGFGRMDGIERPALAVTLDAGCGKTLLLDVGATLQVRASHLVQLARMGAAFMRAIYQLQNPRVGLLSVGEEPTKGTATTVEAHALLSEASDVAFIGNVEGRDILRGRADVCVCDGFTGNVIVKFIEGIVPLIAEDVRLALTGEAVASNRAAASPLERQLSAQGYGAVPLLGLEGLMFVGHGSSDAATVTKAIETAHRASEADMVAALRAALSVGAIH